MPEPDASSQLRVQQWMAAVSGSTNEFGIDNPNRIVLPTAFAPIAPSISEGTDNHSEVESISDDGDVWLRPSSSFVGTIKSLSSRAEAEEVPAPIEAEQHEGSEIGTIDSEESAHLQGVPQKYSDIVQELQHKIGEATKKIRSEPNPFKQASMETQIDLCNRALEALNQSNDHDFEEIVGELRWVEKAEAEEEENAPEAELLRKLQETEKNKQQQLNDLEKELKELADQLQRASSPEERDEILKKLQDVQGKIDAIRPANRQQRQAHPQTQSLGQESGGARHSSGGPYAASGSAAGAGSKRGENPTGSEAKSARLVKSDSQQISNALKQIQKEFDDDKKLIENAYNTYPKLLVACGDSGAIHNVRQQAIDALDLVSGQNENRVNHLEQLLKRSSKIGPGQSVDLTLFRSIQACRVACDEFAKRLESIKEEVKRMTPAEIKHRELSQRSNILARQLGHPIRVC